MIKDNLHAKEVIIGDGEMRKRYILCFNPKEAKSGSENTVPGSLRFWRRNLPGIQTKRRQPSGRSNFSHHNATSDI